MLNQNTLDPTATNQTVIKNKKVIPINPSYKTPDCQFCEEDLGCANRCPWVRFAA